MNNSNNNNNNFKLKSDIFYFDQPQDEYVELLASERDTLRGNTIENRGYLFVYIYVCGCTYVVLKHTTSYYW